MYEYYQNFNNEYIVLVEVNQHWPVNTGMHPMKWKYSLKINTDSFLMTLSSPLRAWPSSVDGQGAADVYNQQHFARKKCASASFINAPQPWFLKLLSSLNCTCRTCFRWSCPETFSLDSVPAFRKTPICLVSWYVTRYLDEEEFDFDLQAFSGCEWPEKFSFPIELLWDVTLAASVLQGCHFDFSKSRFRNCQINMVISSRLFLEYAAWRNGQVKLKHEKSLHNILDLFLWGPKTF